MSYPEEGVISWSFLNIDVLFPGNSAWRAERISENLSGPTATRCGCVFPPRLLASVFPEQKAHVKLKAEW